MKGTPATRRGDISDIAYGFMASQALFVALEIDLFSQLAPGSRTAAELAATTGVAPNRLQTLLHALTGIGLLVSDGAAGATRYGNAPACDRHLVRGAPGDIGDYVRLQIGRQLYPALGRLATGLTSAASDVSSRLFTHPEEARTFTTAQHAGSLAAARTLAARTPLPAGARLLDVGGGSGAFSIAFCERNPDLRATVLDFPAVLDVAREIRDAAALTGRITLLASDATTTAWPGGQDVVLLSYLLSALGDAEIDPVLAAAHASLRPGGLLLVHDFMLDDDGPGPAPAALWFLQYVAHRGDGVSFSARTLAPRLHRVGFAADPAEVLIPEITKVIHARKAANP
jgi:ubiquinone/menaquinone biosynthesis C-methylase UbiE